MLDHFGSGINNNQKCKYGIEWDLCAPGLSYYASAEYDIERNRRIFCRIELAVPLVVDELIVACDCDHGAGHTFSGHLAGEEIVQPDQNPLPTSFGFASSNGAAFATFRTIPATTATVLTVPLKSGSISPIIVATGVCPGCMLKSRLKELQAKGLAGAFV